MCIDGGPGLGEFIREGLVKNRNPLIFQGLPLAFILFPFVWYGIFGDDRYLKGEFGIVENATVVFLFIAIGVCVSSMMLTGRLRIGGYLKAWLVLLILGSTYFALEEISYGQHLFGWDAGEIMQQMNDQQETNLHNVHSIFDQVPRAILTLCILIGSIIMPLYRKFRNLTLDETNPLYWQWPTADCLTIGLLVILIRPVMTLHDFEFINPGETKESLFALFILLYCISIQLRLKKKFRDDATANSTQIEPQG